MVNSAAIVTCRVGSSRLPRKCFLPLYGMTTIGVVIERAKQTGLPVILASCRGMENLELAIQAHWHGAEWYQAPCYNKLGVWNSCFEAYHLDKAILVDGDDLCWDFDIGKRAWQMMQTGIDVVENPKEIICGFFTRAISKSLFQKLTPYLDADRDTDVIDRFLEASACTAIPVPLKPWECNKPYRLTLDYEEDMRMFRELYRHVSPVSTGYEIVEYLGAHPEVSKVNAGCQGAFLKNQARFNERAVL